MTDDKGRRTIGRRTVLRGAGGLGAGALLAGCVQQTGGGEETTATEASETETQTEADETTTEETTEATTEETTTSECVEEIDTQIGMVYALGGLGDKSFNDMANRGVNDAECDLGITFENAQPEAASDFTTLQRRWATSTSPDYELVCCIGFAQTEALKSNAPQYADQRFMIVDAVVDQDNVESYVFKEHEGSFLVGQMAGMMTSMDFSAGAGSTATDSTKVGFVGGVEAPIIKKFQAGFEAGARNANADVEVSSAYVGSFSDPTGGKEAALSMYNSGADIIYHAAGGTGTGVFQAAQEQGRFAIGVDADQSESDPRFADVILASMVKRVDTAVYSSIENVVEGEFNGGGVETLGLERDGVAAVYGAELGSSIPDDVTTAVSNARRSIIDGEISVPTEPQ
jgi:basic membrane protein A